MARRPTRSRAARLSPAPAVQWLRDGLKVIKKASDIEALAKQVKSTGDVVFVPALAGLGAPHWRPHARGLFAGIDRSTTVAHLARAVLEGMALQIYELADAMRADSGYDIPAFKVDGGAVANNTLMQFQADILGTRVVRPRNAETTSLGAAFLGGLGAGIWESTDAITAAWEVRSGVRAKDEQRRAIASPDQMAKRRAACVSEGRGVSAARPSQCDGYEQWLRNRDCAYGHANTNESAALDRNHAISTD